MNAISAALAFGAICLWRGYHWGHRDGAETARQLCELSIHAERERCRQVQLRRVFGPTIPRPSMAGRN